jgi:hypothetical protein
MYAPVTGLYSAAELWLEARSAVSDGAGAASAGLAAAAVFARSRLSGLSFITRKFDGCSNQTPIYLTVCKVTGILSQGVTSDQVDNQEMRPPHTPASG